MNLTQRIAGRYIEAAKDLSGLSPAELDKVTKGWVTSAMKKLKFTAKGSNEWAFEDESSKLVIKVEFTPSKSGKLPSFSADLLIDKRTKDGFETSVSDASKLKVAFDESLADIRDWLKHYEKK